MSSMHEDDNFEKSFKDRLSTFEDIPPSQGWANISSQLPHNNTKKWYITGMLVLMTCLLILFPNQTSQNDLFTHIPTDHIAYSNTNTIQSPIQKNIKGNYLPQEKAFEENQTKEEKRQENNPVNESNQGKKQHKGSILPEKEKTTQNHSYNPEIVSKNNNKKVTPIPIGVQQSVLLSKEESQVVDENKGQNKQESAAHNSAFHPEKNITNHTQNVTPTPIKFAQSVLPLSDSEESTHVVDAKKQYSKQEHHYIKAISPYLSLYLMPLDKGAFQLIDVPVQEGNVIHKKERKDKKESRPWYLQAYAAPTLTYGYLNPNTGDEVFIKNIENPKGISTKRLGYTIHLQVEKNMNERFSVFTDISFSRLKYTTTYQARNTTPDSVALTKVSEFEILAEPIYHTRNITSTYKYTLFSMHTGGLYHFQIKGQDQYLKLGVGFSNMSELKITSSDETQTRKYSNPFGNLNTSVDIGYGIEHRLMPNVKLRLEPSFKYFISNFEKEGFEYSMKPYTFNMKLGISFKIK